MYIYHSCCIQSSHMKSFVMLFHLTSHRLNEEDAKARVWYELKHATPIRRYRPGESKRSRRARAERKEREEIRRHREEVRDQARLAAASKKNSSSFSSSPPSRSYRLASTTKSMWSFVILQRVHLVHITTAEKFCYPSIICLTTTRTRHHLMVERHL